MSSEGYPYKKIGNYLKQKRQRLNESLAEVSGAVEIDIDMLSQIESGSVLPGEDILIMLISHLNILETEARRLIRLAGYSENEDDQRPADRIEDQLSRQILAVLPAQDSNRITYIDQTEVRVTKNGVIFNFQQPGINGEQVSVVRIGVSKDHAKKVSLLIDKALKLYAKGPKKALPAPKSTTDETTKH